MKSGSKSGSKAELASCKTLAKKDHANALDAALDVKRRKACARASRPSPAPIGHRAPFKFPLGRAAPPRLHRRAAEALHAVHVAPGRSRHRRCARAARALRFASSSNRLASAARSFKTSRSSFFRRRHLRRAT